MQWLDEYIEIAWAAVGRAHAMRSYLNRDDIEHDALEALYDAWLEWDGADTFEIYASPRVEARISRGLKERARYDRQHVVEVSVGGGKRRVEILGTLASPPPEIPDSLLDITNEGEDDRTIANLLYDLSSAHPVTIAAVLRHKSDEDLAALFGVNKMTIYQRRTRWLQDWKLGKVIGRHQGHLPRILIPNADALAEVTGLRIGVYWNTAVYVR